jgi:hypothetical protein
MAKRIKHRSGRALDKAELVQFANSSLQEIRVLNELYDSGDVLCARTIAIVVSRLVDDELTGLMKRDQLKFVSHLGIPDPSRDQPHVRGLNVLVDIYSQPDVSEFIPVSAELEFEPQIEPRHGVFLQTFSDWYEDSVFIEGAWGKSWVDNGKPRTEFAKRNRLSRKKVLKLTRDKLGAHLFSPLDVQVSGFWDWHNIIPVGLTHDSGLEFSLERNSDKFSIHGAPVCAFIRTISEEIVQSSNCWNFSHR